MLVKEMLSLLIVAFIALVGVYGTFEWIKPSYWLSHSKADHFRERPFSPFTPSTHGNAAFENLSECFKNASSKISSSAPLQKLLKQVIESIESTKHFSNSYEQNSLMRASHDEISKIENWFQRIDATTFGADRGGRMTNDDGKSDSGAFSFSASQTWGNLGVRKLPSHYVVLVEIPGIPAHKMHVTVGKDAVSIKGTHDICVKKPPEIVNAATDGSHNTSPSEASFVILEDEEQEKETAEKEKSLGKQPKRSVPKEMLEKDSSFQNDTICMERHVDRTFKIPPDVNHEKVSAKLQDGILLLLLERSAGFEREIPVVEQKQSFVDKLKETAESIKEKIHPDL